MNVLKNQSGSVSMMFALAFAGIITAGGAAVVYSEASGERTKLQSALDSAVLAGTSLPRSATATQREAVAASFLYSNYAGNKANDVNLMSVTFKTVDGSTSLSNSVEVGVNGKVTANIPNKYSSFLSSPAVNFTANASARKMVSDPVCVLALNINAPRALEIYGNSRYVAENCATMTNSNNNEGMKQYGSATGKSSQFGVTGKSSGSNWSPKPHAGVERINDPFSSLPFPTPSSCVDGVDQKLLSVNITLSPGTYCGGLTVKAGSNVKLLPGIYIMKDGPFRVDSDATVEGEEIMIAYSGADSALYLNGGGKLTITSPRSGTYMNIQMMSDRSLSTSKKNEEWFTVLGGARLSFDGTLYLPEQQIWINGVSHDAIVVGRSPGMIVVADVIWVQGNAVIDFKQENRRGIAVAMPSIRFDFGAKMVE
jgi:Flp pilus assembly protein TadG